MGRGRHRRAIGCLAVGSLIIGGLVVGGLVIGAGSRALAQAFPFGAEFVLDTRDMPGSRKVPSLGINRDGTADFDLWCSSVKARFVVAARTVTIITAEPSARQCPPGGARADGDLVAALNAVTGWQMDGEALVLTGSRTLRFLAPTN